MRIMAPMSLRHLLGIPIISLILAGVVFAEDWKPIPRLLPPQGIQIPADQRQKIETDLTKLESRLQQTHLQDSSSDLLADVQIYAKAVRLALDVDEFYKPSDFAIASKLLAAGEKRLDELAQDQHPWTQQHGVLVRGYISKIDGSAQPYGLEIPDNVNLDEKLPLYVWLHGRGDKDTDLYFINQRQSRHGQIAPAGAIVLHAFGRQCLGFKSAGEIDVFEAIASAQKRYKIDPDRIILMGFSMGGAGAWHLGAHYADHFAAVHAGAGFIDVARYQHIPPSRYPAWYEVKLWGMYDVPDYVRNLFNVPMVAYGGEIDPQRASSQIMGEAFKAEGHELKAIVGPGMGHNYDKGSLAQIMRLMAEAQANGRDWYARQVSLQTRTLRYNRMKWVTATALVHHWDDSRIDASIQNDDHIEVKTKNVAGVALTSPWKHPKADPTIQVAIDGQSFSVPVATFSAKGGARFSLGAKGWTIEDDSIAPQGFRKIHGLQGPIDDAFMAPFLVVVPSGRSANSQVQKWVDFELDHFKQRWREVFRGDLRIKKDADVTPADMRAYHLVLWGDAESNSVIKQIANQLPIQWNAKQIVANGQTFDAKTSVPVAIYPNPLNPARYVVLNSGPTFREADDRTNSLQNPKLPDWAILDITSQPTAKAAGKVLAAGFFDEHWRFEPPHSDGH